MSELIDRLCARTLSDIRRAVTFDEGMRHFAELIKETVDHIEEQVKRMENLKGKP